MLCEHVDAVNITHHYLVVVLSGISIRNCFLSAGNGENKRKWMIMRTKTSDNGSSNSASTSKTKSAGVCQTQYTKKRGLEAFANQRAR